MRRWIPVGPKAPGGGVIEVLARRSFSGRAGLCLVRIGDGLVLLGLTPNRIEALTEIRDPDEVSRILSRAQRGRAESFSTAFRRLVSQPSESRPEAEAPAKSGSYPIERMQGADRQVRGLVDRVRALAGTCVGAGRVGTAGVGGAA
jgi:hypothetical protein